MRHWPRPSGAPRAAPGTNKAADRRANVPLCGGRISARHTRVQRYLSEFGARKVEANALVVRPEAGRHLCLNAIRRYVPDDMLTDFERGRAAAQIEARAQIVRLLVAP